MFSSDLPFPAGGSGSLPDRGLPAHSARPRGGLPAPAALLARELPAAGGPAPLP